MEEHKQNNSRALTFMACECTETFKIIEMLGANLNGISVSLENPDQLILDFLRTSCARCHSYPSVKGVVWGTLQVDSLEVLQRFMLAMGEHQRT